ncbi:peroxin PEX11-2 [Aspergillus nomiae NRRL 13137]|uniref:Peroxin PEX11-2 n=1 Tax=Aspergillus nomiae NRRL (strain ATCC 15546 / NRRL 13137 / CBS 260.88 / M93) TaxID=1509407 RepID=A0A0L1J7D7_ASPN3|nr:peroxin PEX11-2 [Aspergillus nomiae NRRL 13137]KNG87664.1 peroxin PEX11-2 [Aspergillus nomiae NRRL 13137]
MVANTSNGHPALAHCLRFAATTVGRDKLLRTAQYFSRFYIWHLYRRNHQKSAIDAYIVLRRQLGTTRKILRLGNFLQNLQTLARVMSDKNHSEPVLKFLAIGGQLGFGGYLVFDNITALKDIGIYKLPSSERLDVLADKFWAAGLVCSIMTCIYTLLHSQTQQRTKPEEGERESNNKMRAKERSAAWIQLISDLCDLTVPGKSLGVNALDDGMVGMAGTVSSLIGVWNQWKTTA